jgi:hypothetical protein
VLDVAEASDYSTDPARRWRNWQTRQIQVPSAGEEAIDLALAEALREAAGAREWALSRGILEELRARREGGTR